MNLFLDIIDELKLLKKHNYIHLDLKNDNILTKVISNGRYKTILTDFGLTIKVEGDTWSRIKNKKMGTVYHKAPELLGLFPNLIVN